MTTYIDRMFGQKVRVQPGSREDVCVRGFISPMESIRMEIAPESPQVVEAREVSRAPLQYSILGKLVGKAEMKIFRTDVSFDLPAFVLEIEVVTAEVAKKLPSAALEAAIRGGRIIFNNPQHREEFFAICRGDQVSQAFKKDGKDARELVTIRYSPGLERLLLRLADAGTVNIMRTHAAAQGYHGMLRQGEYVCSAVDFSAFCGQPISLTSKDRAIQVVAKLLQSFPPGHYEELGFPRPKILTPDGKGILQDFDPEHDVFYDVPSAVAAAKCLAGHDIRAADLSDMKPDARKEIAPAMFGNAGARFAKKFADGLNHLHVACEAV